MVAFTPLIWDATRGISRQLASTEALQAQGGLSVDGALGFWGQTSTINAQPPITGDWAQSLQALIDALVDYGLVADSRSTTWSAGLTQMGQLGRIGGYDPGRLIIGSINGWVNLDQPAQQPGTILGLVAHSGPAETVPASGLQLKQLAYSPLLHYGATPPATAPQVAALWFDTTGRQLKIWSGTAWVGTGLDLSAVGAVAAGQLLSTDGRGGLQQLPLPGNPGGAVPMLDNTGTAAYVKLLSIGTAAPWSNGSSIYAATPGGGGRNAGAAAAFWLNNANGLEKLSVWNESSQQWLGVPLGNRLLEQLAGLQGSVADGDLLLMQGGALTRLPAGSAGQGLVSGPLPQWRDRFSRGAAPATPLRGDLWLDDSDVLALRDQSSWVDLNAAARFRSSNGFGGAAIPGQPVVHDGTNWQLATPANAASAPIALVSAGSVAGAPISAAYSGVVTLSVAQWSAVLAAGDSQPAGGGLSAGRRYTVSGTGQISSQATAAGNPLVGVALSATKLLLRQPAPTSGSATADLSPAAPPSPLPGLLHWDPASSRLQVFVPGTSPGSSGWQPAAPAGSGAGSGNPLTTVEAIDWVSDPAAAAIRFTLQDGTTDSIRLRGASGTVVTMADNRTLVIDAGNAIAGGRVTEVDGGRFSP